MGQGTLHKVLSINLESCAPYYDRPQTWTSTNLGEQGDLVTSIVLRNRSGPAKSRSALVMERVLSRREILGAWDREGRIKRSG